MILGRTQNPCKTIKVLFTESMDLLSAHVVNCITSGISFMQLLQPLYLGDFLPADSLHFRGAEKS